MIQRTPRALTTQLMLADVRAGHRALADSQGRISSGRRIQKPSDDPAGTAIAMNQRRGIRRNEQYDRSLADATSWLRSSDAALTAAGEHAVAARSLIVRAANPVDDRQRDAIAADLQGVRDQILTLANTARAGRSLFAGTADVPAAFAADGTYQGNAGSVNRLVADGVTVMVNVPGDAAFGGLLAALDAAVAAIGAGGDASASLAALDTGVEQLAAAQGTVGTTARRIEQMAEHNDIRREQLALDLSEVEDVDLAAEIIALRSREASFEAALAVTARVIQPSLVDFLR